MITTLIAAALVMSESPIDTGTEKRLRSADSFAKDFNAAAGKPRVVAIVAPT